MIDSTGRVVFVLTMSLVGKGEVMLGEEFFVFALVLRLGKKFFDEDKVYVLPFEVSISSKRFISTAVPHITALSIFFPSP